MKNLSAGSSLDPGRTLEESIVSVIGIVSAPVISGFALYRWSTGDTAGALINLVIVAMVVLVLLLGRTQRFQTVALNLFGSTVSAACLVSALFVSNNGLLWALMVLLINSFTLSRRWALGLNGIVIVVLSVSTDLYQSLIHQVSWTTVALLISGFAMMSMVQLREQRQQLARQANVDPLTGAGNRRLMRTHLENLVTEQRRAIDSSTLMVLDIDHFKKVNDSHGHETGDSVLTEFASSVASSLRSNDGFYRMGGEEFVVLLRGMDEATASSYLPKLHRTLSGRVSTPDDTVKFSAGAATLKKGEDWSQWLARADRALYAAKADGRDKLKLSSE